MTSHLLSSSTFPAMPDTVELLEPPNPYDLMHLPSSPSDIWTQAGSRLAMWKKIYEICREKRHLPAVTKCAYRISPRLQRRFYPRKCVQGENRKLFAWKRYFVGVRRTLLYPWKVVFFPVESLGNRDQWLVDRETRLRDGHDGATHQILYGEQRLFAQSNY